MSIPMVASNIFRRLSRPFAAAAVVLFFAGGVAHATDVRELVRQGIERLKSGDFQGALEKLKNAQIEMPDSTEIFFNIGLCHYKLKNWEEAEKSLREATRSPDKKIEKSAWLHLGNCAVQGGKLEEGLRCYERAIEIDKDYEDAKINREYVVRKIKELARKEKEQKEKEKEERQVIEKLQEIIKKQTETHLGTRAAMFAQGMEVSKSTVRQLEEVLDAPLAESRPTSRPAAEDMETAAKAIAANEGAILDETKALVEEIRKRLAPPESAPAPTPGGPDAAAPDPEKEKLEKAIPFIVEALDPIERAKSAFDPDRRWDEGHDSQEAALIALLKALNELLDELAKIIMDQVQLIKDTTVAGGDATSRPTKEEPLRAGEKPLAPDSKSLAQAQEGLKARTNAFARGVEQQLQAMQKDLDDPSKPKKAIQPGDDPNQDPAMQAKRVGEALNHLLAADGLMGDAANALAMPDFPAGLDFEKKALEELVKAREKLSPPKNDQGQKDGEQQQDQKQEEEKKDEKDGQKKDEQKKEDEKKKEPEKPEQKKNEKLSKEQIEKMLDRARQKEKDQRREDREQAAPAGGAARGKDW